MITPLLQAIQGGEGKGLSGEGWSVSEGCSNKFSKDFMAFKFKIRIEIG